MIQGLSILKIKQYCYQKPDFEMSRAYDIKSEVIANVGATLTGNTCNSL